MSLFKKRALEASQGTAEKVRSLSGIDLTLMGVGCIVGAGIFVLSGVAALQAGPAVVLSFIVGGIVCIFAGLCYAEVASKIPASGSVYSYTSVCIGEFVSHLTGWMMIAVYVLSASTVVSGWSSYFQGFLTGSLGVTMPDTLTKIPSDGGIINIAAVIVAVLVGLLLVRGTTESKVVNNIFVAIKVSVILLFLAVGIFYVNPANWSPFMPYGLFGGEFDGVTRDGVIGAAALVFFAYIGFDAISTSAEEVKNPQKNLPLGILGSLLISTLIYVLVCFVLTGIMPFQELQGNAVAQALYHINQGWAASIISLGAMIGLLAGIFAFMYAASRITFAMARDGLLPSFLAKVSNKNAPINAIITIFVVVAISSGVVNTKPLAELANIGVFIAFALVGICLLLVRKLYPNANPDGFKVPGALIVVIINTVCCLALLFNLPSFTWLLLAVWLGIGAAIYFGFSVNNLKKIGQ